MPEISQEQQKLAEKKANFKKLLNFLTSEVEQSRRRYFRRLKSSYKEVDEDAKDLLRIIKELRRRLDEFE